MDLWVVAAAAEAGYIAKFLQKSKEKEDGLVVESVVEESKTRLFLNNYLGRRELRGGEEGMPSFVGSEEVGSTSGFDDGMAMSNEEYNVLSISRFTANRINEENVENKRDLRSKKSLRTKRFGGYNSVKPLSSLDSCVIAQLYNEHVEMEEYVFSSLSSPRTSNVRPLLVTDGSQIISRANSDICSLRSKLYKEDCLKSDVKERVVGVPPLPEIGPLQLPKKTKQKRGKGENGRLGNSNTKVSGKQFHAQGSLDKMFLFCLGITFGVMSTVMANKSEADKLNELLKQSENLVQDLQEELEMKDSLTVKVLPHEGYESQENNADCFANQALTSFSSAREVDESLEFDIRRTADRKSGENSESMSKIEAELEAELERLELNMNASCLERRLSGLVELDPDSVADIVQGELRVDMVNGGAGLLTESDRDMSGTSTTHTENVNYAVSPREISLRLHEVIQSRLEERIRELENALENSQKSLHLMESKQINLQMNYSNSEIGSSSQDSPTMREESNTMAQPLFLSLSDDALDAYNEAYEALNSRIIGIYEESPPSMECKSNKLKEEVHSSDRSVLWSQNGGEESGSGSTKVVEIQDESDTDDDDEMGRLLIKQILEKTRQGSPVVLNAQRMLFSVDEKSPLG